MKKNELPPCHVEFLYGQEMHTHKVSSIDFHVWKYCGCDESLVKDDTLYKVWLNTRDAADPADFSLSTRVFYFEEVPKDLVEMKAKVDSYWKSEEPLDSESN